MSKNKIYNLFGFVDNVIKVRVSVFVSVNKSETIAANVLEQNTVVNGLF